MYFPRGFWNVSSYFLCIYSLKCMLATRLVLPLAVLIWHRPPKAPIGFVWQMIKMYMSIMVWGARKKYNTYIGSMVSTDKFQFSESFYVFSKDFLFSNLPAIAISLVKAQQEVVVFKWNAFALPCTFIYLILLVFYAALKTVSVIQLRWEETKHDHQQLPTFTRTVREDGKWTELKLTATPRMSMYMSHLNARSAIWSEIWVKRIASSGRWYWFHSLCSTFAQKCAVSLHKARFGYWIKRYWGTFPLIFRSHKMPAVTKEFACCSLKGP